MKSVINILWVAYAAWVFIVFTSFMLLFLPGIIFPFLFGPRGGRVSYFFLFLWAWVFSKLTFIRYEIYGRNNIRQKQSFIFVSNHTSYLDLPGIRLAIPGEFRPLAKKELKRIPVFGWIIRAATVSVDRSNAESRKRSLQLLKDTLQHRISILLFAEGTQNRTREILQPFHDGAFRIAVDAQQPLIPIVVIGAGKLMPPGTIRVRPGKIRIFIGKEIATEGLSPNDVKALKANVFDTMKNMIIEHS